MNQSWMVGVSPAQRFEILKLTRVGDYKVKGSKGRQLRRLFRALAIDVIERCALENNGVVNAKNVKNFDEVLFEVTEENIDCLVDLYDHIEHSAETESVLGDLVDRLLDIKRSREQPNYTKMERWNSTSEKWAPILGEKEKLLRELAETASEMSVERLKEVLGVCEG